MTASPAEKVLEAALLDLIQEHPEVLAELRMESPALSLSVESRPGTFLRLTWLLGGAACLAAALVLGGVGVAAAIVAGGVGVLAALRTWALRRQTEESFSALSGETFAVEPDPAHYDEVVPEEGGFTYEHLSSPEAEVEEGVTAEGVDPYEGPAVFDFEKPEPSEDPAEAPLARNDPVPLRTAAPQTHSPSVRAPSEPRPSEPAPEFLPEEDPLTEADFHIDYGMYDQAAELLRAAIEQDPGRRELRLKLLDVYFEMGNRHEFLLVAEELVRTRYLAGPGEREKIAIMGRQIAPKSPLFADGEDSGAAAGAAARADLDLDLESGESQVDYEILATAQTERHVSAAVPGRTLPYTASAPAIARESGASTDTLAEDDITLQVTVNEVGIKLDLARAYVNLGDPAGARGILEEVLKEGSAAQQQEAQELLQGLSG